MDFSTPLVLFIIALISPFGVPLGATFFIISAGSLSGSIADYLFFVILIFFGLVIGDIAAYAAASYFETVFSEKLCRYKKFIKKCESGKNLFKKYGGLSVFLSRFVFLGFGAPINYISGFSKYSLRKFLVYAASGEFLYASIYTYIGFAFKDSWLSLFDIIVEFSYTILLFFVAVIALYQLKRYL
ncbi:MAG: VTT domain-containing protein [Candidatus Methanoperedens sp.]|nr:VTT domain-containing protein [Candidatus Methanoperedens sp.]